MKVLVFDTETTGKPIDYNGAITDLDNWPRVIQLGWAYIEGSRWEEASVSYTESLIKPDGWEIPEEKFWIDNGYSTEKNDALGVPMPQILDAFIEDLNKADIIVAHNMAFDYPVLCAEMIRYDTKAEKKERKKICTMQESTNFCKIPGKYRNYKWPNLTELHTKLFGVGFDGAHDALSDVKACAASFFKLVELNVIKL